MPRAGDALTTLADRRAAAGVLAASLAAWLVVRLTVSWPGFYDLGVYRAEGLAVRHGDPLYGALQDTPSLATYPPFSGILFVPVSLLPEGLTHALVLVANLALTLGVACAGFRLAGVAADRVVPYGCLLTAIAIWCEPVYVTMNYGQINLVVVALVLWDFRPGRSPRWQGVGIGLATAIKVTPGIFVLYLLLTRRWRAAATAVGVFVATLGISAAVQPRSTWRFWTDYLFDVTRVGRLENAVNQSLRGVVVRVTQTRDTPSWVTVLIGLALLAAVVLAARAYEVLGDAWGVAGCAVAGLLCAPIAWSHHWVWCVPVAALLIVRAPWWTPTLVVFVSFAVWAIPHADGAELHLSVVQLLASGWYVLFGLVFLGLTARRTYLASHVPAGQSGEPTFSR